MNDIEMFEAVKALRADQIADYIEAIKGIASRLLEALPGDKGGGLSSRIFGAPLYKAMVTHLETLSIQEWDRCLELFDSWKGHNVVVVSAAASATKNSWTGRLDEVDVEQDTDYRRFLVSDLRGASSPSFSFEEIQDASISPDGVRFIIIG